LRHCRHGIVSYYSEDDWFNVGLLTEIFGTMDRKWTSSAGKLGFLDRDGQPAVCDGLTQIAWIPEWRRLGHYGGHGDYDSRAWAREVLAPVILADAGKPVSGE